ncbi:hypothetical protein EDD36DRAFT_437520 [Exophiala viscosa]|uniref:Secreted protein n=1 Tax=Exophiala viscosa TaxID=2486360 RepID=A0AAN6IEM6_9EURO|nr:hypothetical protein EDD36DRAFT_437520 [Exophiala viscosa]
MWSSTLLRFALLEALLGSARISAFPIQDDLIRGNTAFPECLTGYPGYIRALSRKRSPDLYVSEDTSTYALRQAFRCRC